MWIVFTGTTLSDEMHEVGAAVTDHAVEQVTAPTGQANTAV